MKNDIKRDTIIRTIVLFLNIINNLLTLFDKSPLPIDDETASIIVSFLFTSGASIWAWWKNNSFTEKAIKADEYLKELRKDDTDERD